MKLEELLQLVDDGAVIIIIANKQFLWSKYQIVEILYPDNSRKRFKINIAEQ